MIVLLFAHNDRLFSISFIDDHPYSDMLHSFGIDDAYERVWESCCHLV